MVEGVLLPIADPTSAAVGVDFGTWNLGAATATLAVGDFVVIQLAPAVKVGLVRVAVTAQLDLCVIMTGPSLAPQESTLLKWLGNVQIAHKAPTAYRAHQKISGFTVQRGGLGLGGVITLRAVEAVWPVATVELAPQLVNAINLVQRASFVLRVLRKIRG
jgi:hypothetical protein